MKRIQGNLPITGASLLAAGLMLGVAGTASAVQINANTGLSNVNGSVKSGSNAPGPNNVSAQLGFSVPQGAFGSDFSSVVGSSNPVDFSTSLSGNINAGITLTGSLAANKTFSNGSAFNDFLTGGNQVSFDSASLNGQPLGQLDLGNPLGSISGLSYAGGGTDLADITGGTLNLSGNNDTIANLNADGTFSGDGSLMSLSDVMENNGGGDNGGMAGGGDNGGGDNGGMTGGGDNGGMMGGGDNGGMTGGGDNGGMMGGGDNGGMTGGGDNGGMTGGGDNGGGTVVSVDAPSGTATLMLMSLGLVGIGVAAKRRQRKSQNHDSFSAA